ncbi:MAG: outer membrane lipoprotein-sorting protein [Pontiellaceae bacterium]|nr:outer membrane lipoprotein-sorting protein [Pontiellaceae bacterium]MBN2783762.1 outer membrane lipoprotein-sorting protein [Pontiellaceae bacterium]
MKKAITALAAVALTSAAFAELSANEIVTKANDAAYYAGNDGRAQVEMSITDKDGGTRTRKFTILRMDTDNGTQKFYVYFKEPADLYKQVFLVWKEVEEGKNDSRWMWLPALNLKREIAPGDKRTSFVGSDFVYEDVSGRSLGEDHHELIETTDTQYVIRNTPKKPDDVEFSYYTVRIDKDTFLPRKAEYFDKNGKLYRTVEATKVDTVQGFPTVTESVVKDLNTGGSTINRFTEVEYDIGLKESIFTERFLRRPPREVTK